MRVHIYVCVCVCTLWSLMRCIFVVAVFCEGYGILYMLLQLLMCPTTDKNPQVAEKWNTSLSFLNCWAGSM